MTEFCVGNHRVQVSRLTLSVSEAAEVLEGSRAQVRRMVAAGELSDVSTTETVRLDPAELAEQIQQRPLAQALLAALVSGQTKAADRYRSMSAVQGASER